MTTATNNFKSNIAGVNNYRTGACHYESSHWVDNSNCKTCTRLEAIGQSILNGIIWVAIFSGVLGGLYMFAKLGGLDLLNSLIK